MLVFQIPNIQIQTQESPEKANLETSVNKHTFLIQGTQKAKMGSLNRLKINKNTSLDLQVSFLVLPNLPGSPPGPARRQSEATKHAKLQVWYQKCHNPHENWSQGHPKS